MTTRTPKGGAPRRTYGRSRRLIRTGEFRRVYALRASAADARLVIYAAPNGREVSRAGVSVGRKNGSSVRRNRIKRLLREAWRLSRGGIPEGYDFVLVPRDFAGTTLGELLEALPGLARHAVRKAHRKSTGANARENGA